jgi:hypothetical protein
MHQEEREYAIMLVLTCREASETECALRLKRLGQKIVDKEGRWVTEEELLRHFYQERRARVLRYSELIEDEGITGIEE